MGRVALWRSQSCARQSIRTVALLDGGDKADAGTLILEWSRQRKDLPSAILALVLVCVVQPQV